MGLNESVEGRIDRHVMGRIDRVKRAYKWRDYRINSWGEMNDFRTLFHSSTHLTSSCLLCSLVAPIRYDTQEVRRAFNETNRSVGGVSEDTCFRVRGSVTGGPQTCAFKTCTVIGTALLRCPGPRS